MESQEDINTISGKFTSEFKVPVPTVNFFKDDTRNITSELEEIFAFLVSVDMTNEQHMYLILKFLGKKFVMIAL